MSDTLQVEPRDSVGSRSSQRLRASGKVPVVLYGHKEDVLSLAVSTKEMRKALSHRVKVVNLTGAADGQALVQDVQWDTFHRDLLHIDFLRVSAGEKVHVAVPVELKGEAAGSRNGGVVEQLLQTVELEAAPANIPEILHVSIETLDLGGTVLASEISDLPDGAVLLTAKDTIIVRCVKAAGEPSVDAVGEEAGQPEVIGEKSDDEKPGEGK